MAQVYPPPRKNRLLLPLLMQCLFMIGFVTQGFAQATATLPSRHQGPWQTGLPTGWTQSGLGTDKTVNLGTDTELKSSANFDHAGDFIEINFDDIAGQVAFMIRADGGRNYSGLTFEVHEKPAGGVYSTAGQKINPTRDLAGERVVVSIQPTTRTVKLVLASVSGGTATVDDVIVAKAVPKINIKQGTTDILSSSGSYGFGIHPLGGQSEAVTFTIENTGTADLVLTDPSVITVSGANPSDFIVDFSATATTIVPGSSTTFTITFKPIDVGSKSATISIANNDPDINPYTFTLTGESVYCPIIDRLDIYEGKVGDYVYIIGANLDKATRVTFGGVDAVFYVVSADTIDVSVPMGAVTGPVEVFTAECSAQSATFTVLDPTITISKTGITMSTEVGTSVIDQYQVSASYLYEGEDLVLNVDGLPGPFTISRDGVTYSQSITFLASEITDGTLALTTIYVKYSPTEVANHTANISHTSSGAETQNLSLNGTATSPPVCSVAIDRLDIYEGRAGDYVYIIGSGLDQVTRVTFGGVDAVFFVVNADTIDVQVPEGAITGPVEVFTADCSAQSATFTVLGPTINVTAALTDFATEVGTPSASQSYTVSGTDLEGNIAIGAPTEFEVSLDNITFTRTVSVPLPAGSTTIGETTIFVRYNPGTSGTHSGNIMHTSLNATDVALAVNGSTSQIVLPVELMSFKATAQGNKALLEWVTASEKDNSHFEIETSLNAADSFEKVGRVDSKTINSSIRTSYAFSHNMGNASGIRYYRLKQVDLDGTSTYSKVVAVTGRAQGLELQVLVAPNPLNYNSKVYITVDASGKATVTLHDMSGKRMYQKIVEVRDGHNETQLPLYDQLPNGVYVLTVELNGQRRQVKVVKQ